MTIKKFFPIAALAVVLGSPAFAQQSAVINQDWEGHKAEDVCFAISFPKKEDADRKGYLTVSNRPADKITDEVAVVSGFAEDANIEGSLKVDDNSQAKLLVYKGTGFLKSKDAEKAAVAQMKAGRTLEVKWRTEDGEYVVDTYSLYGFTASRGFAQDCK